MSYMKIADIADTVGVLNRFAGTELSITHDGVPVVWAPGETKYLPRTYADWFIRKSVLKTSQKGVPTVKALVIVGIGGNESVLDPAPFEAPHELIERDPNIPTMFDNEGRPLHAVVIPINGVAGLAQEENAVKNAEAKATTERVTEQRNATTAFVADTIASAEPEVIAQLDEAAKEIAAGKHGGKPSFTKAGQ